MRGSHCPGRTCVARTAPLPASSTATSVVSPTMRARTSRRPSRDASAAGSGFTTVPVAGSSATTPRAVPSSRRSGAVSAAPVAVVAGVAVEGVGSGSGVGATSGTGSRSRPTSTGSAADRPSGSEEHAPTTRAATAATAARRDRVRVMPVRRRAPAPGSVRPRRPGRYLRAESWSRPLGMTIPTGCRWAPSVWSKASATCWGVHPPSRYIQAIWRGCWNSVKE